LLCSGCIDSQIYISLAPDGSGTIEFKTVVTKEGISRVGPIVGALASANLLDGDMAADVLGIQDGVLPVKEVLAVIGFDTMAGLGPLFGPGVHLYDYIPYDSPEFVGFRAMYRFKDLNQIRLGSPGNQEQSVPPWMYKFAFHPGSWNQVLLIPPHRESHVGKPTVRTRFDALLTALAAAPVAKQKILEEFGEAQATIILALPGTLGRSSARYRIPGETSRIVLFGAQAKRMTDGIDVLRVLNVRSPSDLSVLYHENRNGVVLQNPLKPMVIEFRMEEDEPETPPVEAPSGQPPEQR